jgi:hypothetical protein
MARTFRALTLLACLACTPFAHAQSAGGHIAGVITDDQGAPVPEVFVTAHGTDQSQRILTDADGQYRLHDLVAGRYVLTAARDGYTTVVRNGVMVRVGKTAALPLVMKVEPVKEEAKSIARARVINMNPQAGRTVVAASGSSAMLPAYNPVALLTLSPPVLVDQRVAQIRR